MGTGIVLVLAVALLLGCAAIYRQAARQQRREGDDYASAEHRWMPDELRTARLETSEHQLTARIDGDAIPVRPDQVYRTSAGQLVAVDTKVRRGERVYPGDVIEVSIQRLALSQASRYVGTVRIAPYAYIRLRPPGGQGRPVYKRVDTLPEAELVKLYRRYQDVVAGRVTPRCQTNPRACAGCGHVAGCASAAR